MVSFHVRVISAQEGWRSVQERHAQNRNKRLTECVGVLANLSVRHVVLVV